MTINGFNIKKYRARVKARSAILSESVDADGYKIVKGYVSISSVILNPKNPTDLFYMPIFVAEEIDLDREISSGFGRVIFKPMIYEGDDFTIIEEVE